MTVAATFIFLLATGTPRIEKIAVEPAALTVTHAEGVRPLVIGITRDGERVDLTSAAKLRPIGAGVKIAPGGFLVPAANGATKVAVTAAGKKAELPVTVRLPENPQPPTFFGDVMPIMNKVGCTQGTCHGAAKGKNGFKLSLRGYDPEFDYRALVHEISGRRFNRVDPPRSLMLMKATQQVAHGGGLRIELGSRYYKTIVDWISAGGPLGDAVKDKPVRLEVLPAEIFTSRIGAKQQMLVVAHYPDGTLRDVTREAVLSSNSTTIAEVSADAVVTALRKGEAAILVRYEGRFVTVPLTVIAARPGLTSGFTWAALPQNNYVDELIDAKLKRLKIQPSPAASDAEFLRRVSLDLTGIPPVPEEVRAFVADSEPKSAAAAPRNDKRSRAIDRLLARPEYVDHWSLKWADLLQNSRKYVGEKGNWAFQEWIRKSVAGNKPYDKMVRELLTARGSTYENPAANFYRVAPDAKQAMEKTSQLFLGVRMVCAQCHDHPFEQWTQNSYYELAAFFSAVGVKAGVDSDEEIVFEKRDGYEMRHPKDNRVVEPRFLIASLGAPPVPPSAAARREALVEWLTSPKNPFFARAIANRVWSYFFGRGIIEPVDDIRASNPPVNEALLAALAKDLTGHGYDLKHLIRTIVNSRTYQASLRTNDWNSDDETNFSHALPRRMTAEQLADAIAVATGARPKFPEVPPDTRAEQLPGPHVGVGGFLDLFGRPARETSCECERRSDLSLPQALSLVNGPAVADAITDPKGRVAKVVLSGTPERDIINELYMAALSRTPDAKERELALAYFQRASGRAAAAQDLLWALLNSNAFLFVH